MPLSTWNSYIPGPKIFDFFFNTGRWQNTTLEIGLKCLSWPEVFKTPPFFENHELRHTVRPQNVIFMKIAILWKKIFPKFKKFFFKRNALFWATFWCTLHIDHFNTLSVRWRTVNKNFKFKKWANFKKKFFGPPGDFSSKILYPRTF